MRIFFYLLLTSILYLPTIKNPNPIKTISILSTDLSLDRDPDDWFDTFLFLTTDGINPTGILLENYATDSIQKKAIEFANIIGNPNIPVVKGIQQPLKLKDGRLISTCHEDGAEFILNTMKKAKGKVRLIAVGSLRNEAMAYRKNPVLFKEKIDRIYFAGGTLNGEKDTNVLRDTIATRIIIDSDIPIVWIPCTEDIKQKLSGEQEKRLEDCSNKVCSFLTGMLASWREYRGNEWLDRTQQIYGQGKNLWSLPAFAHIENSERFKLNFVSGTMTFDNINWTGFDVHATGKDLMLIDLNHKEITEWVTQQIISKN